ncbi:MAG: hypothetical protein JWM85_1716, partial [Acidimicrobiaceae bacterium]|nr:hypothetical protein [Acidimicrobiaceae bacterium]
YTEVVRCCHRDERGRCVAIGARLAEQLLEASGTAGELEAVHGVAQTDFVPREADKGRAIRSLLARDPASERLAKPLAFAIGDSGPDVPMLELAEHPFVPAHAAGLVLGAKATVTTRAYQAGTAQAVGAFLGHAPGTCPRCAAPVLGRDERVLVDLLSLHEAGKRAIPARLVGLGRDALAAQAARKRPGRAHDAGVAR